MQFIKTNPHPAGKKTGDCVVRALAIAEDKNWLDVYDRLCKIGRRLYKMPNSKDSYEDFLTSWGWVKQKMPKQPNGKRYTVKMLAEKHPEGRMVIATTGHLTVVLNGDLYDLWDCSKKSVGNYYTNK